MSEFDAATRESIENGDFCSYVLNNLVKFNINSTVGDGDDISESDDSDFDSISQNLDIEREEDDYVDVNIGMPFDLLAEKMKNLTQDGKIKKLITKESFGKPLDPSDIAWVNYCFYLEGDKVPFDSSYSRSKDPVKFNMDSGEIFMGLAIALMSMKAGEKAQFIIHYDYAFGEMGMLQRVPPKSTILAVIDLVKITNQAKSKDKSFEAVFKDSKLLYQQAVMFMNEKNAVGAKSKLRIAERNLEEVRMSSAEEDQKRRILLCDIYILLLRCYNSPNINMPKVVCTTARKALDLMPAKMSKNPQLYFERAIAYITFRDFPKARQDLEKAKKLDPANEEIDQQLLRLKRKELIPDDSMICFDKRVANPRPEKNESVVDYTEFKNATLEVLREFKNGTDESFTLLDGLNTDEIKITTKLCETLQLFIEATTIRNKTTYTVYRL